MILTPLVVSLPKQGRARGVPGQSDWPTLVVMITCSTPLSCWSASTGYFAVQCWGLTSNKTLKCKMIMIGLSGFCSPTPRSLSACMGTSFPPTQHNRTQHKRTPPPQLTSHYSTALSCVETHQLSTALSSPHRAQTGAQSWNARHQLSWFLDSHCLFGPAWRTNQDSVSPPGDQSGHWAEIKSG